MNWVTIYGTDGATTVSGVIGTPLKVKRAGVGYDIILSGSPGSRQVFYNSGMQTLTFLVPFSNPDPSNDVNAELIYVLYK